MTAAPLLRIDGLNLDEVKSIRHHAWPRDGLGWGGRVPDTVVVGGINGSGKTTLLEVLFRAVSGLTNSSLISHPNNRPPAFAGQLHVHLTGEDLSFPSLRIDLHRDARGGLHPRVESPGSVFGPGQLPSRLRDGLCAQLQTPSILFLPASRELTVIPEEHKKAGPFSVPARFAWRFAPPAEWKESLESRLYDAMLADLIAKDEGRPNEATTLDAFRRVFELAFDGRKKLVRTRTGDLVIEVDGGATHGLEALSSGEKQIVLIGGELLHRWRPGSLVLIDEPELHLHPSLLAKLWSLLVRWRAERGGQLIVATQSSDVFQLADPGTKVLLGREPLA